MNSSVKFRVEKEKDKTQNEQEVLEQLGIQFV